jgi:hypothetical protein
MPHNNRMTTSATLKTSEIWSKTIGHDPYANQDEQQVQSGLSSSQQAADAKVKTVMAMARNQNVTDGSNREGFTAKLYLGLKRGKVRRSGDVDAATSGAVDPKLKQLLEDPDSSSEEEFVEVSGNQVKHKEDRRKKKRKRSKKRKKRSRHSSSDDDDSLSSSSSDDSDDDSSYEKRRRRRREKRKRGKKKSHSKQSYDDSNGDSEEEEEKKRRKLKRHRSKESKAYSKASNECRDNSSESD